MPNENKPPMFGPSAVFDLAAYAPRSGKSALMNAWLADFAEKPNALAQTIIGSCTTTLLMKSQFDPNDNGHLLETLTEEIQRQERGCL